MVSRHVMTRRVGWATEVEPAGESAENEGDIMVRGLSFVCHKAVCFLYFFVDLSKATVLLAGDFLGFPFFFPFFCFELALEVALAASAAESFPGRLALLLLGLLLLFTADF